MKSGIWQVEVYNQIWQKIDTRTYSTDGLNGIDINIPGTSACHSIVLKKTETNNIDQLSGNMAPIRVYPNPSSSDFLISTIEPHNRIEVFDMVGRIISQLNSNMNVNETRIGAELGAGVNILETTFAKGSKEKIKVIKK